MSWHATIFSRSENNDVQKCLLVFVSGVIVDSRHFMLEGEIPWLLLSCVQRCETSDSDHPNIKHSSYFSLHIKGFFQMSLGFICHSSPSLTPEAAPRAEMIHLHKQRPDVALPEMLGDQYFVYEPKNWLIISWGKSFHDRFQSSVERIQVIKLYSSICFCWKKKRCHFKWCHSWKSTCAE